MSNRSPITPQSRLWDYQTVGLLGGSFNPAHDGHRHIAEEAIKRLGLDAVWMLVSPQNPLKSDQDMAPFADRLTSADTISSHPRVFATDIESKMGTSRTFDSVLALFDAFPKTHFIWLMGADNMQQFSTWYCWRMIADNLPIAIFDRPTYSNGGLSSQLAREYARDRVEPKALKTTLAPAWSFVTLPRHPASATMIRRSPETVWPA